jgi:hypothetical protein
MAGTWEFRESGGKGRFVAKLEQKFQQLSGRAGNEPLLSSARVLGADVHIGFVENGAPTKLAGRVDGDRIDAQVTRRGKTSRYIGTRTRASSGG